MLATVLRFLIGYTAVSILASLALAQLIRRSRKWSGWQSGADSQGATAATAGLSESFFAEDLLDTSGASDRLLVLHQILTPGRALRREPAEVDWAAPADVRQRSPRVLAPAGASSTRQRAEAPLSEISPVPIL
ncbi:MAG TPA: hypothetical protein VGZ29_17080 [Terriglobia bacterium]|nr:hypothetical protein [Terriglobia bacterium]